MNYKDTLNLPHNSFPMKANLPQQEPKWLEGMGKTVVLRNSINKMHNGKYFQLFSGSPYSNGDIHVGHSFNYILKDFIARSKRMNGCNVNFTIGWDNHGLPIELVVEKQLKGKRVPNDVFRKLCRKYAEEQVAIQKQSFYRLGISADFDNPYHTMDYQTESNTVKALANIYQQSNLVSGKKPTHFCFDCQSSLAEAEVEYYDKNSKTAYVGFYSSTINADLVAYTTTIWTLPANEALAVNPELYYSLFEYISNNQVKRIIIEEDSGVSFFQLVNATHIKQLEVFSGKELSNKNLVVNHPFLAKQVPIVCADYVSNDVGTGIVHIAPTFGMDDYQVGKQHSLPMTDTVNTSGEFIHPMFTGKTIHTATNDIISLLQANDKLYFTNELTHSYPHCWRHKTPTIFMATPQWFIKLDQVAKDAVASLDEVEFYPVNGKVRLTKALQNRPDWCISRQRRWGVPIPIYTHKDTKYPHPDTYNIMLKVSENMSKIGLEAWFDKTHREVLGVDESVYNPCLDTLDVWFDSGVQFFSVCAARGMQITSDVYLEGSDQHRGWFQSSILTAMAMSPENARSEMVPYKNLITHGFVLDKDGKKMSKSLGNVISPNDIVKKYGADVLRLWVANSDYQKDVRIGDEILERVSDQYRKLRNTIKHLVNNLHDYDYDENMNVTLLEYDQYTINRINEVLYACNVFYQKFEFSNVITTISEFCTDVLSNEYINNTRDRVYTYVKHSNSRRSAQTVYFMALKMLYQVLEPIIPFTMHELKLLSEQNNLAITLNNSIMNSHNTFDYSLLNEHEKHLNKTIEQMVKDKVVNSSSECVVSINTENEEYIKRINSGELKRYFNVAEVLFNNTLINTVKRVSNEYQKCERCWNYSTFINSECLCNTCANALVNKEESHKYM